MTGINTGGGLRSRKVDTKRALPIYRDGDGPPDDFVSLAPLSLVTGVDKEEESVRI